MILAQTFPYVRDSGLLDGPSPSPRDAEHGALARAALGERAVDALHLFVADQDRGAIDELRLAYGAGRIAAHDVSLLPALAADRRYVVAARANLLDAVARGRAASGRIAYPVFGVLDELATPQRAVRVVTALVSTQDCDVLIVPGVAAAAAAHAICREARHYVEERFRTTWTGGFRIAAVSPAFDDRAFVEHDRAWCRQVLDLPQSATVLLYVGSLSPGHVANLEPILGIYAALARPDPRLHLLLAGRNATEQQADALRAALARLGLLGRVRVFETLHDRLRPFVYAAADLFLAPADNIREPVWRDLLEAMAAGLPVVASDWNGSRELVLDDHTGHLVPTYWSRSAAVAAAELMPILPGFVEDYLAQRTTIDLAAWTRGLRALIDNPERRRAMGASARAHARRFAWSTVIREYEAVWREQWERLERRAPAPAPRVTWDVARPFEQYATRVLGDDDSIRGAPSGRALCSSLQKGAAPQLPAGVATSDLAAVLEPCADEPVRLGDLVPAEPSRLAASWLLKKGYVSLVEGSEP